MAENLGLAVLVYFPQVLFNLYAPLGLIGAPTTIRRVIVPGLVIAAVVTMTRSVPLLFGWHIPLFLIVYIAVVRLFNLASSLGAVAAAALSFILVVLGDILLVAPAMAITGVQYADLDGSFVLHVIFGWLESVPPLVGVILVKWRSVVLIPVARLRSSPPREEKLL